MYLLNLALQLTIIVAGYCFVGKITCIGFVFSQLHTETISVFNVTVDLLCFSFFSHFSGLLGRQLERSYGCMHYVSVSVSVFKGCQMGRSDTVSLWCVSLLINTRFRFFILE